MAYRYCTHTIFLGCMLVMFTGFAKADIVQCVDETRTVTYTDTPCKKGADVARVSALTNPSAVSVKVSPSTRIFSATGKARKSELVKKRASNRGVSIDVATLKAARSSMLLNDHESSLVRQQKLAALDQNGQRWFNF